MSSHCWQNTNACCWSDQDGTQYANILYLLSYPQHLVLLLGSAGLIFPTNSLMHILKLLEGFTVEVNLEKNFLNQWLLFLFQLPFSEYNMEIGIFFFFPFIVVLQRCWLLCYIEPHHDTTTPSWLHKTMTPLHYETTTLWHHRNMTS